MTKAFTRESDAEAIEGDADAPATPVPAGSKNYLTPGGYRRLREELQHLMDVERPDIVRTVSWAASNGDRSENGDYLYGKKRLREIDRRIRFLIKRLDIAEVVDSSLRIDRDRIFFGARVRYLEASGIERRITIVGIDESEPLQGRVSWISPIARALTRARVGDEVSLRTPAGPELLEVLEIDYPTMD